MKKLFPGKRETGALAAVSAMFRPLVVIGFHIICQHDQTLSFEVLSGGLKYPGPPLLERHRPQLSCPATSVTGSEFGRKVNTEEPGLRRFPADVTPGAWEFSTLAQNQPLAHFIKGGLYADNG